RKRWIAHGLIAAGNIYIDDGAVNAICQAGKSLLAAGVINLEGDFQNADAVRVCNAEGREIARGIVNYSSAELQKIRGCKSEAIRSLLGDGVADTVIHRDNLVLV
ncbi:MAG: PUA domain-containing protein, partial [Geitlerinemataceae cyanobacterium]